MTTTPREPTLDEQPKAATAELTTEDGGRCIEVYLDERNLVSVTFRPDACWAAWIFDGVAGSHAWEQPKDAQVLPVKLLGCEALHTDSALRELQRLRERVRTLEADARRYRWHRAEQFQGDMSEQDRRAAYAMYDAKLDEEMRPSGEPERSAEAAPKCETCGDNGYVACVRTNCECEGLGADPCP